MRKEKIPSIIGASAAIVAALIIFLILYWGKLSFDPHFFSSASIPEPDEEELFLDPELIDPGEEESPMEIAPQAEALGSPEVVEEPKPEPPVVKGEAEAPAPPKPKEVTQTKKSEVKSQEPKKTDKPDKKVEGKVANAFTNSGNASGKNNSAGAGGQSFGISGSSNGWKFIGCPEPKVSLRNKVTVKVSVTVNAEGIVTRAKASGGNADIRRACEAAARQARWQPLSNREKKTADGVITFTITPR